jgi:hypothetical protein
MSASQNFAQAAPSNPPAPPPPTASKVGGGATPPATKKPEEKTDHFRRAVTVGVVFVGVIASMVMVSGLLRHPKVHQNDVVGRAPVADQTAGAGLQSYDQALVAYKAAHHDTSPAQTGPDTAGSSDNGSAPEDPADLAYVHAAWRKPMMIKDRPADDHPNQPAPQQPGQVSGVPLPPLSPGFAPQQAGVDAQPLQSPAQLAARYQAVEERLQRLRLLQQQAAQGQLPAQGAGAQ